MTRQVRRVPVLAGTSMTAVVSWLAFAVAGILSPRTALGVMVGAVLGTALSRVGRVRHRPGSAQ